MFIKNPIYMVTNLELNQKCKRQSRSNEHEKISGLCIYTSIGDYNAITK